MSNSNCAVVGCSFTYKNSPPGTRFFVFPNENQHSIRRKAWTDALKRCTIDGKLWIPSSYSRVCSRHFINGRPTRDPGSPGYIPRLHMGPNHGRFVLQCARDDVALRPKSRKIKYMQHKVEDFISNAEFPSHPNESNVDFILGPESSFDKHTEPCEVNIKTEIKEEPLWTENVNHSDDHEVDIRMEIKEEPFWEANVSAEMKSELEAESTNSSSDLQNNIKGTVMWMNGPDEENSKSSRLHTEEICNLNGAVSSVSTSSVLEQNGTAVIHKEGDKSDCERIHTDEVHGKKSCRRKHTSVPNSKQSHMCEVCGRSYTKASFLEMHKLIHLDKKPHKCEICEQSFTRSSCLQVYYLVHKGKRLYSCKNCAKHYTQVSHFKRHNLVHEGKQPYTCEVCGKNFVGLLDLKSHNLIHEDKRPYKCEICKKDFIRMSHLQVHNLIHEGKRRYSCTICEKSYTRASNLKNHSLKHKNND